MRKINAKSAMPAVIQLAVGKRIQVELHDYRHSQTGDPATLAGIVVGDPKDRPCWHSGSQRCAHDYCRHRSTLCPARRGLNQSVPVSVRAEHLGRDADRLGRTGHLPALAPLRGDAQGQAPSSPARPQHCRTGRRGGDGRQPRQLRATSRSSSWARDSSGWPKHFGGELSDWEPKLSGSPLLEDRFPPRRLRRSATGCP